MSLKLRKKNHFNLGILQNTARIVMRKTFSNTFVTLTDIEDRVIVCKTSGNSGIRGSKRRKRVPQALETIIKSLNSYFKLYKITNVEIIMKMRVSSHFHYLLKELNYYGIDIIGFYIRREVAFNGVRGRKLRRL